VTTTPVPPVDVDLLREEIRKTYAAVSQEPEREFIFPTGRAWAEDLDYPAELANVPDSAVESFAGVANPFSLGRIEAGAPCARPGIRSGNRFARRRADGRPLRERDRHRHDAGDARQGARHRCCDGRRQRDVHRGRRGAAALRGSRLRRRHLQRRDRPDPRQGRGLLRDLSRARPRWAKSRSPT